MFMTAHAKTIREILLTGLETITNNDEFNGASGRVLEDAFNAIFEAQNLGKLQWRRSGGELRDFTTEAVIKNAKGEEILISVYLYVSFDGDGFRGAYLTLVERGGTAPCRNNYDQRVQKLFFQLTGETWTAYPIMDRICVKGAQKPKSRRKFLGIF